MATKIIAIESGFNSSIVEIPYNEKYGVIPGDEVIFKDSEDKEEYGLVKYVDRESVNEDKILFTSRILRKATANDIQKVDSHVELAKNALRKCKDLIESLGLDMNVFKAGYSLDGSRVFFVFTAEDRVDFRELVKQLAKILQKQIHLRQIGPRDKAKLIGGYGKCGRPLCCTTWLGKLESINMEMVRVQGLESKGSSKLSGACGKLLCCLKYEVEAYRELRKQVPRAGSIVRLKKNPNEGIVIAVDVLNQKVKVAFEKSESLIVQVAEIDKVVQQKEPNRPLRKEAVA